MSPASAFRRLRSYLDDQAAAARPEDELRLSASGVPRVGLAVGACYLAVAVAFSVLTPAWENNDEFDHVEYIEHVAADWSPPRIGVSEGIEAHQPPLYYYIAAAWQRVLGIAPFTVERLPIAPEAYLNPTSTRRVLVHDYTPAQHDQAVHVHLLRLVSIACGLATVLAAVVTGWLLTGRTAFAGAVGATVALWPKFVVVSSAVTNTSLVIALCSCAVPCLLLWSRLRTPGWAAATGCALGAAALTQFTSLPVAGLILLVLVILGGRSHDWRSPLIAVGCFALIAGWWFVRNAILYGDPLASAETRAYLADVPSIVPLVRDPPNLSPSVLSDGWAIGSHSTWYDGGWNQLQLPSTFDWVVWALAAISLGAAAISSIRDRLFLAIFALGGVIAWLILATTIPAEGRYLLVAIVAWAALFVAGAERLFGNRRAALWVWPGIMLALDAYVLANWVIPDAAIP
jgi:hypothetical protein